MRGTPWAPKALFGSGRQAQSPKPPRQAGRTRCTGRPRDPDRTRTPGGGNAPATRGGQGREPQAAPQGESRGAAARPPPPPSPPARKPRGRRLPPPPEAEGMVLPPPAQTAAPERGVGAMPAPLPQLPAPTGTAENKRTHAKAPGRHADRARRRQASTNRSGMGATPSMTTTTPVTPALLPAQGRQRDGTRQSDPPPHCPPPAAQTRGTAHNPPPPAHPPAPERPGRADPPHGERNIPNQVGGKRDRAAPPQARRTEQGTGA